MDVIKLLMMTYANNAKVMISEFVRDLLFLIIVVSYVIIIFIDTVKT